MTISTQARQLYELAKLHDELDREASELAKKALELADRRDVIKQVILRLSGELK